MCDQIVESMSVTWKALPGGAITFQWFSLVKAEGEVNRVCLKSSLTSNAGTDILLFRLDNVCMEKELDRAGIFGTTSTHKSHAAESETILTSTQQWAKRQF